jgi:Transposase DDE domain group 1
VSDATSLVRPRRVTADGEGLSSRAGLVWLGRASDRFGMTAGLSDAVAGLPWRRHHPGIVLSQVVVGLASGATCLSDLAVLRSERRLFGRVASRRTVQRVFAQIGRSELEGIARAQREGRRRAWAAGAAPDRDGLTIIDVDATVVTTKADKEDARPTYQRTYGHHPLLAMVAATSEVLCGLFRPGNASPFNAEDHIVLLRRALQALPEPWRAGHRYGDDPSLVQKPVLVRGDTAAASHWLAEECANRNLGFSVGYALTETVRRALALTQEDHWAPALTTTGQHRRGAQVVELTDLVNLADWPEGTRLICRRERPHPGAQLSLFDDIEGFRHTAFLTNQAGDPNLLEARHRARGAAESVIRDAKACGLANLPFDGAADNDTWMQLTFAAKNLLAWAQHTTLAGPLRHATPKTIRHRLLHIAGRVTANGQRLRIDNTWPWAPQLLAALDRLTTLTHHTT